MKPENKKVAKLSAPVLCTAVVCITIIECFALSKGIDGKVLTLAIALIAGIAGYKFGNIKSSIKRLLS